MIGGIYFAGATFAGVLGILGPLPAVDTAPGISIGGVTVSGRVRIAGLTVRDILNDAPNTCQFQIDGDGPAVGQPVRVVMGSRLLFSGAVQTVAESFTKRREVVSWSVTAIDDTGEANARRPFGTWVDVSATTIAQEITANFAPGFSPGGIAAGLPAVRITFDGGDTFIACLTRLANVIGGYCKVEDRTVFLFLEDTSASPDPIDDEHCFLHDPPIRATVDASQLRTRVYGKGYGETVQADLAAGETRLPIQVGTQFPQLGGTAIVGQTAEGAQSTRIAFTGVDLGGGGSLVGTGAAPSTTPPLQLEAGSGVTPGLHTVSVAYRTAAGVSLAGPPASITTGTHPPPETAPTAAPAITGTGPDQGSHDYAVSFVTAYGETTCGPVSNAVVTSAATGQLPPPSSAGIAGAFQVGAGLDTGTHDYKTTFINATGETDAPSISGQFTTQRTAAVVANGASGTMPATTGGSMEPATYAYFFTAVTPVGESLPTSAALTVTVSAPNNACNVPLAGQDPRATSIKVYRSQNVGSSALSRLVTTVAAGTGSFLDTVSQASIAGNAAPPTVDNTTEPMNRLSLSGIALGPAGTMGRRLYRRFNTAGTWKRVTTINNNTQTTFLDTTPNSGLGVDVPASNTTGTATQVVPLSAVPLGPAGVTARKLYRRFNGVSALLLVTTIPNNTATTFNDTVPNAALGPPALGTATAVANQIRATIQTGPPAVTAREIFMSPVGLAVRRSIAVLNDNTTTNLIITASDAIIAGGALEPAADTSGLQQPSGQVNPGATVLPVASSAPFRTGGGWVTLGGGQVVKYAGINGNTLTGIPAAGSGAIGTTVIFGSQAIPAPMLTGVTGLTRPMLKGAAVHLWIQRDDLQAQAEHAARTGGSGIVEFLIVDTRRGLESLAARCEADLAQFSRPLVTVTYVTRDMKTKSGKTVEINLASPPLVATLTIQDVTISGFGINDTLPPRYAVTASSVRFSLEDTLRRLIAGGQLAVNN